MKGCIILLSKRTSEKDWSSCSPWDDKSSSADIMKIDHQKKGHYTLFLQEMRQFSLKIVWWALQ